MLEVSPVPSPSCIVILELIQLRSECSAQIFFPVWLSGLPPMRSWACGVGNYLADGSHLQPHYHPKHTGILTVPFVLSIRIDPAEFESFREAPPLFF